VKVPEDSFKELWPLAWTFHRNTNRWPHNALISAERDAYQGPGKEYPDQPFVRLPPPAEPDIRLFEALKARYSCRRFIDAAIGLDSLSICLFAAYGVTGKSEIGPMEFLERMVPSGGGLYPLELYVVGRKVTDLAPGVYHYDGLNHGLELIRDVLVPKSLSDYIFMGQDYITTASLTVVLTMSPARTMHKYGDRGYRYALLEAGHVAQNLNIVAGALNLGTCNVGGFFDDDLSSLLKLDLDSEVVAYAVALGIPDGIDRSMLRAPTAGAPA
jgi:SagB-type dehydrogenase family enzyme